MSDLVGNPNCWFCHAKAQFISFLCYMTSAMVNGNSVLYVLMAPYVTLCTSNISIIFILRGFLQNIIKAYTFVLKSFKLRPDLF